MVDDIYKSMRYFLICGKLMGILPLYGLRQTDCKRLSFRRKTWAACTSLLIVIILGLNGAMASLHVMRVGKGSVYKVFGTSWAAIYYTLGACIYMIFLKNSGRLIDLFKMWNDVSLHVPSGDTNLTRDVSLIAGLFTVSYFTGNILLNLKFVGIEAANEYSDNPMNMTGLELFYVLSHKHVACIIPFNPIWVIFLLVQNQLCLMSWWFGGILICVISRALNFKLKSYFEKIVTGNKEGRHSLDLVDWTRICHDYEMLGELVEQFRNFLSPLVFTYFGANLFFLSLEIWTIPTDKSLTIALFSSTWAVFTTSFEMLVLNIEGARIHSYGRALGNIILKKCPLELFPSKTSRIERILEENHVGLTGLGCFTVTNTMLLHAIGIIFTIEVLLMQGEMKV